MTTLEVLLTVLTFVFVITTFVGFKLARRYYRLWQTRQTGAYRMGSAQVRGDFSQILGDFAVLNDYEQLILLSTTSQQASLDLLGVKADALEFIEFKKKGALLQPSERKIKRLVDQKKVNYVIKDVELPDQFKIDDRSNRPRR